MKYIQIKCVIIIFLHRVPIDFGYWNNNLVQVNKL